jgi:hypothetical protein
MDRLSSNYVSHPLMSHIPSSDIVNIPCSHPLNLAPHLLMCYAQDLEMCYAPNPNLEMCHASYPKMWYAMKLTDPNLLVHTTISYKQCLPSSGLPL